MSVKSAHKLKALQSEVHKLESEINLAENGVRDLQKGLAALRKRRDSIEKEISRLKAKAPVVSEHALLRYIERSMGVNLEEIKNLILSRDVTAMISSLGNGTYPIPGGLKAVVRENTIISIV